MPYMAGTEIMTLGRLPLGSVDAQQFEPMLRSTFMSPRRVTPQQPQNLLRAVTLSGLRNTARLISGLGDAAESALDLPPALDQPPTPEPSGQVAMNFPSLPSLPWQSQPLSVLGPLLAVASLSLVSAAVAGYHGYRRDKSVMAGVGWGFMGALFPVVTPIVSFAQGYAKPRSRR